MTQPQQTTSSLDPTTYNITWLERFLRQTRRRYWFVHGLQATLNGVLGLVLWSLLLVALREVLPSFSSLHWFWWAGVTGAGGYTLWAWWGIRKQLSEAPIAQKIEQWNPNASGFLTALELGRTLPTLEETPRFSESLTKARIDQVASHMRLLHPTDIVPFAGFRWRAYTFLAVAASFFCLLSFFPKPVAVRLGSFFGPPNTTKWNPLLQKEHEALVVGDLKITYRYPLYANLPPRVIHNSDGSLEGLKGTTVLLKARALFPIASAAIRLNNKSFHKLKVGADKRTISGQLDLLKPGFYRFVLVKAEQSIHRGPTHPIQLQPDAPPTVKLLWPKEDLELQSHKGLRLAYKFRDDFGVSKIYLVYRNTSAKHMKKAERKLLNTFARPPRGGEGQDIWDLQSLPFSPGDRIAYYIEVQDNDTITGPKKGRSETRYVRIFSPLKQHDKMLQQQEKLLTKMVAFLADLIEFPKPDKGTMGQVEQTIRKLNLKGKRLLGHFTQLIPKMQKDPLAQPYTLIAMENLRVRLNKRQDTREELLKRLLALRDYGPALRRDVTENRTVEVPLQEDDVYALKLLIDRQRLDLLAKLSRQLSSAQNKLRDLLETYRNNKTKENKRALLRQMDRVESILRQIQKRMQQLSRQMPDDTFLNWNANQNKNSINDIRAMRQMIKTGNVEDAVKKLDELARKVERMVSQMDNYAKEAGGALVSRMAAAMQKMIDDLHQLEQKQRRLARRTQAVRRQVLKRMKKALKKKFDALVKKQLKRTKRILQKHKDIKSRLGRRFRRYSYHIRLETLNQRIKDLEEMLKQRNLFESLQLIQRYQNRAYNLRSSFMFFQRIARQWQRGNNTKQIIGNLRDLQYSLDTSDKIRTDLQKFFPSSKPYMNKRDKQLLKRYQQYQKQLTREARQMQQKLQRMSKRMPVFRPKMQQRLGRAAKQMRQASGKLGERTPRDAYDHQQRAISQLQRLRQSMKQSMQPQGKRGGKGKRGQRGGGGGKHGRMRRYNQQKVNIPKPGQNKAPKALRKDILDAMKEKLPRRYRDPVRKYYEKLVK